MNLQIPTYSEKVLNQFACKQWPKVLAYLKKHFFISEADCEDVFQEAFIVLFNNNYNGKLKDMTSSLSTYFISICRNKAFELLRSKGHDVKVDGESSLDILNGIKEEKIDSLLLTFDSERSLRENKEAIARQIVHDLPQPCNDLLWGFFRDNYSIKTLADMLNKTVGYVKVTKHRCQEKFRKRWSDLAKSLF